MNLHTWDIHNHEQNKVMLDYICSKIASRFNLYDLNGRPRRATIIEIIARSPCLTCIVEKLSKKTVGSEIDSFYKECHKFAVNILVEELFYLLTRMGYKIAISTERDLGYGKADILVNLRNYGLSLKNATKELIIEVKTGNSLSLSQIFRYLLDSKCNTIIVWRIRRRQVLTFDAQELRPLLEKFTKMLCLRGLRLLATEHFQPCNHVKNVTGQRIVKQSKQEALEAMFRDFSKALTETLPSVLQIILEKLEMAKAHSSKEIRSYEEEGI